MKIRKAFKFQLKAQLLQKHAMSSYAGTCRFAWNKALAFQKERLEKTIKLAAHVV